MSSALCWRAAFMLIQVTWSNTSLWVTGTLGGTVAQAGMASGMMSLFSCIGRLFFGKIYGKLGRFTIHLDLALLIVGMALASHSHSYAMALVALAFVGVSMAAASAPSFLPASGSNHLQIFPLALFEPPPEDHTANAPIQTHRKGNADHAHLQNNGKQHGEYQTHANGGKQ